MRNHLKICKKLHMKDFNALRSEIDLLHTDFLKLVLKRFHVTAQIWQHKKSNGLPFLDEKREQQLIQQFDDQFDNEVDRQAFQSVMKSLIEASKISARNKI